MIELCGSILAANHAHLLRDIRQAEDAGISRFHIDVCDGHYTRKIIFGDQLVRDLRIETRSELEIHIAVYNIENILKEFLDTGADIITVQYEVCEHPSMILKKIKSSGIKSGMTFIPATAFQDMEFILEDLNYINILGVEPGIGGQNFNPEVLGKIEETANLISRKGLDTKISVDGGVNLETLQSIQNAGADILIVGTAVFKGDLRANIMKIKGLLDE
ncbi:MAG: ribulose-phosphate 3-epimerase [Spirochaetaceae bacterium]|nr:ribulose-phosphate 3-epimerase [Spirochaetaceae bacterium]